MKVEQYLNMQRLYTTQILKTEEEKEKKRKGQSKK